MRAFQKCVIFIAIKSLNQTLWPVKWNFGRFYLHDLSLIILQSRDRGYQFWKKLISPSFMLNFRKVTKFHSNGSKSPRVMDKNLWEVPDEEIEK